MKVEHSCGHIVDVPGRVVPFIRRSFCNECEELAKKLQEEQHRLFQESRR